MTATAATLGERGRKGPKRNLIDNEGGNLVPSRLNGDEKNRVQRSKKFPRGHRREEEEEARRARSGLATEASEREKIATKKCKGFWGGERVKLGPFSHS